MNYKEMPFVSIAIPTYNSEKWIGRCLESIYAQDYAAEKFEVIIADGKSSDRTTWIAKKKGARVVKNPLRDAQNGKAVALRHTTKDSKYVILVDSDNEFSQANWLRKMISILEKEPKAFGAYSDFTVLQEDPAINRISVMMASEDPVVGRIADIKKMSKIQDRGEYHLLEFMPGKYPLFGANGFVWRRSVLFRFFSEEMNSFDEADLGAMVVANGYNKRLHLKESGICHHHIHTFGEFVRKRIRSAKEYIARSGRKKDKKGDVVWLQRYKKIDVVLAILFCASIVAPLFVAIKNYRINNDRAWFLYPLLSFVGVIVYSLVFIIYFPFRTRIINNKEGSTSFWNIS